MVFYLIDGIHFFVAHAFTYDTINDIGGVASIEQSWWTAQLRLDAEAQFGGHVRAQVVNDDVDVGFVLRRGFEFSTAYFAHEAFGAWNFKRPLTVALDSFK